MVKWLNTESEMIQKKRQKQDDGGELTEEAYAKLSMKNKMQKSHKLEEKTWKTIKL